MSTEVLAGGGRATFDLDSPWQLHPQVSVRPEHFGALLYHFGTRRLSFLKSPVLLDVVTALGGEPSARAACAAAGIPPAELPAYAAALATLAGSQMICERAAAGGGPVVTEPVVTEPVVTEPVVSGGTSWA